MDATSERAQAALPLVAVSLGLLRLGQHRIDQRAILSIQDELEESNVVLRGSRGSACNGLEKLRGQSTKPMMNRWAQGRDKGSLACQLNQERMQKC